MYSWVISPHPFVMHCKGYYSNSRHTHKNGIHSHEHSLSAQNFNQPYASDSFAIMGFDTPVGHSPGYHHPVRGGRLPGRGYRGRSVPLEAQSISYSRLTMDADTYHSSPNYTMKSDNWNPRTSNFPGSSRGVISGADSTSSCESGCSNASSKFPVHCRQSQPAFPNGVKVIIGSGKAKNVEQLHMASPCSSGHPVPRLEQWLKNDQEKGRARDQHVLKCPKKSSYPHSMQNRPVGSQYHKQQGGKNTEFVNVFRGKWLPYNGSWETQAALTPQWFLTSETYREIMQHPRNLCTGGEWDKLSEGVWEKFMLHQQKEKTYYEKIRLWQQLSYMIKYTFPDYSLFLVGSTMTGFGCNNSDVDMCLLVRQSQKDSRSEAVMHLEQTMYFLKENGHILDPMIIQAKVPILKFRDRHHGFEIDLNCNNSVGIRNTHLLYCYEQMDWRVRPLVLVVKLWAQKRNINDAKNMTISSYSLTLMVIHFLQCGVTPPVLPCLHSLFENKFSNDIEVSTINMHEQLKQVFMSKNEQTLGELLHLFLQYYVDFDYSKYGISVRLGQKVPIDECRHARSMKNDPHQWKCLAIEEPFDLTNTARSVYDHDVFEMIKKVFASSLVSLQKSKCIESIFQVKNG